MSFCQPFPLFQSPISSPAAAAGVVVLVFVLVLVLVLVVLFVVVFLKSIVAVAITVFLFGPCCSFIAFVLSFSISFSYAVVCFYNWLRRSNHLPRIKGACLVGACLKGKTHNYNQISCPMKLAYMSGRNTAGTKACFSYLLYNND